VRTPDIQMYTTGHFQESLPYLTYEEDITSRVHATGDAAVALGLRQGQNLLLFAGNTDERTISTALRVEGAVSGSYRSHVYISEMGRWTVEVAVVFAERLTRGIAMQLDRKGFWVLDLK